MGTASTPPERLDDEATIRSRRSDDYNRMFPQPLTEAQRRFWALRDSGYTGWIDQDGKAVTEDGTPVEEFKLRSLDIGHDCASHDDTACPSCGHCRWRHHGKQGCDHGWTGISKPCGCLKEQDDDFRAT